MVKGWRLPALGDMAGGTVAAELALVGIFRSMAADTVTRGAFKNVVLMAAGAFQLGVLPIQHDARFAVIEGNLIPAG